MPYPELHREPRWHRQADRVTGVILYAMLVFSPWAFGSWPTWAIWAMNSGGYLLGALWFAKIGIRRATGFEPARWGGRPSAAIRFGLGGVTGLLLTWCLISALNARAVVDPDLLELMRKPQSISWLPHSYDQPATWFAFWQYLGLAGVFWALRDWIVVASPAERRLLAPDHRSTDSGDARHRLPHRLRRWLWLLSINGGALALVGTVSTIDNPTRLLWLLPMEERAGDFFGPFYYRNNGAAYVNLIWPLCLGLWLTYGLRAARRGGLLASIGRSSSAILPICFGLMLAAPFISNSRGGSIITVLLLASCLPVLFLSLRRHGVMLLLAGSAVLVGGGLGLALAWEPLSQRFFRDFVAYPTGVGAKLDQFTIRSTIRIPATWGEQPATFAGLSDDARWLWNTPGSVTLSLRRAGLFQARFVEGDRTRVLTLSATHPHLAEAGRTVELIFTHRAGASALFLNGQPLELQSTKSAAGFDWPEAPASKYLWVGRGAGGSMRFNERIEVVTFLDRALPDSQILALADSNPQRGSTFNLNPTGDGWSALDPRPRVSVRPYTFSPSQWVAAGLGGRGELHAQSREMLASYPAWLGTGPGTFARLFMVFRQTSNPAMDWFAHDDHLETRITFGLVGAALVYLGLLLCATAPLGRAGVGVPWYWLVLVLLGLAGALVHARFDWVFQTHALLFLGVVLCAVLSVASIRTPRRQRGE